MIRLIPALVLVLILALFGLSNRQEVVIGFWPTDYAVGMPLSVAILVGMALAFLAGAAVVWLPSLGLRRRARRAEALAARLQAQLAAVELRQAPMVARGALPVAREPALISEG
jgi:putative membrane protein